jgi:hypothetical protein
MIQIKINCEHILSFPDFHYFGEFLWSTIQFFIHIVHAYNTYLPIVYSFLFRLYLLIASLYIPTYET